jgi:glycosyltransferase involved in cell wall biosynthesis
VSTPLVSVVIPCYRQAHYLREAVDSALSQSHPAVEVIVVNDGSDDDTEAVAGSYGDRIQYVWQANAGLSAARNAGTARARGPYLKFLDADDHLHPDQVAWQVGALAGRDDAVSLTTVRLYRDGHPDEYVDHVPNAKSLLPELFQDRDWGGIHGWLFPTSLARAAGGFDPSLRVSEDWDFLTRVGLQGARLLTDPHVGCYYRLRARSMSTDRPAMAQARGRLLVALHDAIRERGRDDWFGLDLLKAEQAAYQGMVLHRVDDRPLLDALLARIQELQKREGFGLFGWRFRLLTRLVGYAWAERIRAALVRGLNRRPVPSLDTGAWRDGP